MITRVRSSIYIMDFNAVHYWDYHYYGKQDILQHFYDATAFYMTNKWTCCFINLTAVLLNPDLSIFVWSHLIRIHTVFQFCLKMHAYYWIAEGWHDKNWIGVYYIKIFSMISIKLNGEVHLPEIMTCDISIWPLITWYKMTAFNCFCVICFERCNAWQNFHEHYQCKLY